MQKRRNFIVPKPEKYICGHCGKEALGGRYNNHCPSCLWSKHVDDKVPGDRNSKCRKLMGAVGVVQKGGKLRIVHRCTGCGKRTVVDMAPKDNMDLVIKLSQQPIELNVSGKD